MNHSTKSLRLLPKKKKNILVILVIILIILVIILFTQIQQQSSSYNIRFGVNDLERDNPSFHIYQSDIDKGHVSGESLSRDITYRELLRPSISLALTPKTYPNDLEQLSLKLQFKPTNYDLSIIGKCESCDEQNISLPLYFEDFESYQKIEAKTQYNDQIFIYTQTALNDTDLAAKSTIETWIDSTLSTTSPVTISENVYADFNFSFFENKTISAENTPSVLPYTFAPQQEFYIYTNDDVLEISFEKNNNNIGEGLDKLIITTRTISGQRLGSEEIKDDGITSGNRKKTTQTISDIKLKSNPSGITILTFKAPEKEDFELSQLSLDTNKIVFNRITSKLNSTFYTAPINAKQLQITTHEESAHGISITNQITNEISLITDELYGFNHKKHIPLSASEYEISLSGSHVIENVWLSHNKEAYFNPFTRNFQQFPLGEFVVTATDIEKTQGEDVTATTIIKKQYIPYLLNKNNSNEFKLTLASNISSDSDIIRSIWQRYKEVETSCDISIFSLFASTYEYGPSYDCSSEGRKDWITSILPDSASLKISSVVLENDEFIAVPDEELSDYENTLNTISTNLQGEIHGALYTEDGIYMSITKRDINKYSGSDDIAVTISDIFGNIIDTISIEDDGDASDSALVSLPQVSTFDLPDYNGLFLFSVIEKGDTEPTNDYIIESIELNTNKIVFTDTYAFRESTDIYFSNSSPIELTFRVKFEKNINDTDVIIDDELVSTLTTELRSDKQLVLEGNHNLYISDGSIDIAGTSFAFSTENFFNYSPYAEGYDYIITDAFDMEPLQLKSIEASYR